MRRRLTLGLAALLAALAPGEARSTGAGPEWTVAEVRIVDALPPSSSAAERLSAIRRRIQAALVYPPDARWRSLEGVAVVRFRIDTQGHAEGIRTARSSGHWILDRAAARAVTDAAPLPYVWGRLEVPVHFTLTPNNQGPDN